MPTETRPLSTIAKEILADYHAQGKPVYYSAVPYVRAMLSLDSINDSYGDDSAKSIVAYALSNLSVWRGETARRIKAELKGMI